MTPSAVLESALYVTDLAAAEHFYGTVLGLEPAGLLNCRLSVFGFTDDFDAGLGGEQGAQSLAEEGLVVYEEQRDGTQAGTSTSRTKPSPCDVRTATVPPSSCARSRSPRRPKPSVT